MTYINPKRQPCDCHAPHFLCPIGRQLLEIEAQANTAAEYAVRFEPERVTDTARALRDAREAYNRHIGIVNAPPITLNLSLERLFFGQHVFPAETAIILDEMRRLYAAAGEPLPLALGGSVTYTRPTPPPLPDVSGTSWTVPAGPWLYTAGEPQEPELDA